MVASQIADDELAHIATGRGEELLLPAPTVLEGEGDSGRQNFPWSSQLANRSQVVE